MTWKQMKTTTPPPPPRRGKKCCKLTAVQEMQPLLSSLTVGVDTLFGEAAAPLWFPSAQKSANHSLLAQPVAGEVTVFSQMGEYVLLQQLKSACRFTEMVCCYYYFNLRNVLRWISQYSGFCWWRFLKGSVCVSSQLKCITPFLTVLPLLGRG